jgi:aryl-alcohol dehydrogenase-like predicted oxidoreductase
MEYRPLGRTGLTVSVLGYGASPLGGLYGPVDVVEVMPTLPCVDMTAMHHESDAEVPTPNASRTANRRYLYGSTT